MVRQIKDIHSYRSPFARTSVRMVISIRMVTVEVRMRHWMIELLIIGFTPICFKTVGAEIIIEHPAYRVGMVINSSHPKHLTKIPFSTKCGKIPIGI